MINRRKFLQTAVMAPLLLACTVSFSQNLYFPTSDYTDSASMEKNLPALARQVIPRYNDPNRGTYYDNLFRLQLLAGEYQPGLANLDTAARLIVQDSSDIGAFCFNYRVFYHAQLESGNDPGKPFSDLYRQTFGKFYRSLPPVSTSQIINLFSLDPVFFKRPVDDILSKQKSGGKDSISLRDAVALCRAWLSGDIRKKAETVKDLLMSYEKEDYLSDDSVLIKTPDGGVIALSVVRRKDMTAPSPVVLMYSIYPGRDHADAREAASRGYVGIVANTRGKRLSPDVPEPFEHDAKDAYTIIDWISQQRWCNGKVGMYGGSYLGFAQWSAVKYLHPALKTIVPQVAVGIGIDYPMMNGVFQSYMLQWIHYVANNKYTDEAEFGNENKWDSVNASWYKSGRSYRALDTVDGRPNAIFQRWLDHPAYDSYWQNMTPQKEEFSKINIPILTISGYWDADQLGAIYYFKQHHQWNRSANHYLLIGPYNHSGAQGFPQKRLGSYTLDSAANIPIQKIVFEWFDHVLKDSSLPSILSDKVNYEVMGANKWNHAPSLNAMSNDTLTFYLGNAARMGSTAGDKRYPLLSNRPPAIGFIDQQVDFKERPVDSGKSDNAFLSDTIISPKKDLVFVSDPLQQTTTLSGAIQISVDLLVNKKDVDFATYLYEQTSDGKYLFLNFSVQRASYAKDRTKRQLLHPGKMENVNLSNNFLASLQMPKGSRFVLTLGINNNPDFQVNYGSGKDVSSETIADAATPLEVKWYNSSRVTVPILK